MYEARLGNVVKRWSGYVLLSVVGLVVPSSSAATKRQPDDSQCFSYPQRLRRTLYLLIQENEKGFTPLQYAIAADISLGEAKTFLKINQNC